MHYIYDSAHSRDEAHLSNDSILIIDSCTIHHGAAIYELLG